VALRVGEARGVRRGCALGGEGGLSYKRGL